MDDAINSKNHRLFNEYIFLTTFSRNLIEVFIGTILYKKGFTLHQVIFYYLLVNAMSLILCIPCMHFSKKYSNKVLSLIGVISFFILQLVLNIVKKKIYFLYITAFFFSLYRRAYWLPRRYYLLQIMDDKKNISSNYSVIAILNQLGIIVASYVGSILLEFVSINVITLISFVLLSYSVYILFKLDFKYEKNDVKINLKEMYRCAPKSSVINIFCYELQNVYKFLFPLFVIIYVKNTYTAVGIISLIANIASLIFIYLYGRLINNKRNYLKLVILLLIVVKVLQINSVGILLIVASFLDGFVAKMYEQSFHKEHVMFSKNFEYSNYNYMFEITQNVGRVLVVLILYIFFKDIKTMLYVVLAFISIGILFKFNTKAKCTNSPIIWKEK